MQAMLKARTWFGSQDRSRPHSLWMASDSVHTAIHVHSRRASSQSSNFFAFTASGRLQAWASLVQRLCAFDAGLVRVAVGPLGNASDARGQALVWEPRSQRRHSFWMASDGVPVAIHVHSRRASSQSSNFFQSQLQVGSKFGQALCRGLMSSM